MIVVDSSALVDVLTAIRPAQAAWVRSRLDGVESWHAPQLVDAEVAAVVRRLVRGGALPPARGELALAALGALPLERYDHVPLLARVWQLRENVHAFDAFFAALAEALEAPLVTTDAALAGAPGIRAEILAFRG